MPGANQPRLYNLAIQAVNQWANELTSNPLNLFSRSFPVYRYGGYLNGPQNGSSIRTIHKPLADDQKNRWSGLSVDGHSGTSALYVSTLIGLGRAPQFTEQAHYHTKGSKHRGQELSFMPFKRNEPLQFQRKTVHQLNSMFSLMLTKDIRVLDLTLSDFDPPHPHLPSPSPVLWQLFNIALAEDPDLMWQGFESFRPGANSDDELVKRRNTALLTMHYYNEDASFSRGIANGVFNTFPQCEALKVTSVRGEGINLVIRGVVGQPSALLMPLLRCTFIYEDQESRQIFTKEDQLFNDSLMATNDNPVLNPVSSDSAVPDPFQQPVITPVSDQPPIVPSAPTQPSAVLPSSVLSSVLAPAQRQPPV
jgi:hypothetical protein